MRARGLMALAIAGSLLGGCRATLLSQRASHPAPVTKSSSPVTKSSSEGEQDEVREVRAQALAAPREPYWPFRLGQIYLAGDSVARAVGAFSKALECDRFYAPALSQLSMLHYRAGRHDQAIALLEPARSNPDAFPDGIPPALMAGLALHYEALGRQDRAREVMASLPRPDRRETASASLYLALRGALSDSAASQGGAAARERRGSAAGQNNYGITRLRAADPEGARRAFSAAIELDPQLPGPYYNLAIVEKFHFMDDAAAARWFKLYWQRSNDDPDGLAATFGKADAKDLAKKGE